MEAGQAIEQPGIDRAEPQVAGFGKGTGAADIIEKPFRLCSREVRVEQQARPFAEQRFQALVSHFVADRCGTSVLPDDGVGDWAAVAVPEERGLALIRDADRGYIVRGCLCLLQRFLSGRQLRLPDLLRVVFNPARLRVYLLERLLGGGNGVPRMVKQDGATGRCPLV